MPSRAAGLFFKLYLLLDLFSRKIVAYEVWAKENAEHSQTLLCCTALSENLASVASPVVLHGAIGSPLKAGKCRPECAPSASAPRTRARR